MKKNDVFTKLLMNYVFLLLYVTLNEEFIFISSVEKAEHILTLQNTLFVGFGNFGKNYNIL